MSRKNSPTRTRILDATLKLLESRENQQARMSDIAKAARISRQALYLHFPTRLDLLIATVRYVDEVKDVDARLAESRAATGGAERLAAWVVAWGNYIPEIHAVARALSAMGESDAEAQAAWQDRMRAVREGCAAVTRALSEDGILSPGLSEAEATDLLASLISVPGWETLCVDAGWPQARYITVMQELAARALIDRSLPGGRQKRPPIGF